MESKKSLWLVTVALAGLAVAGPALGSQSAAVQGTHPPSPNAQLAQGTHPPSPNAQLAQGTHPPSPNAMLAQGTHPPSPNA